MKGHMMIICGWLSMRPLHFHSRLCDLGNRTKAAEINAEPYGEWKRFDFRRIRFGLGPYFLLSGQRTPLEYVTQLHL